MRKLLGEDKLMGMITDFLKEENVYIEDQKERTDDPSDIVKLEIPVQEGNGLIGVLNGQLILQPPDKGGSWPVIKVGQNIDVFVRGEQVLGVVPIESLDEIKIISKEILPVSDFQIEVSDDWLKVDLKTKFIPGKRFKVLDSEPKPVLNLRALAEEEIPPEPIKVERVYSKLALLGLRIGIDYNAIAKACSLTESSTITIAIGTLPIPPRDAYIEYTFQTVERIKNQSENSWRVDYFDKGHINSVEAGAILAIWHPPIAGTPGMSVSGRIIDPPEPKNVSISVGPGAKLIEDGKVAIATKAGRPTLVGKNKIVKVVPELVINNDLDINLGHIDFKGDVIINGNVTEGLVVNSGGRVVVNGSVFHARVYADGDVVIKKNLIGGYVCAGGEAALYRPALKLLDKVVASIDGIIMAYKQLKGNPRFSLEDLQLKGDGPLIKMIVDTRYPSLGKVLQELQEFFMQNKDYSFDQKVGQVIELIVRKLVGLGPIRLSSVEELGRYLNFLEGFSNTIKDSMEYPAEVLVGYCQETRIDTSGSVKIVGDGLFRSKINAGEQIAFSGFCRGGELYAAKNIVAGELGSTTWVETHVGVGEKGQIKADLMYPNVTFSIGAFSRKNYDLNRRVSYEFETELIRKTY